MPLERAQCQVPQRPGAMLPLEGDGSRKERYWIGVPPEGAAVSLPVPPIAAVACQRVNVLLMKKWRVPVVELMGSAHAWNPDATLLAPLHAVNPETPVPASETV